MPTYLGIDQSLNGTGVAFITGAGKTIATYRLEPPPKYRSKRAEVKRLVFVRDFLDCYLSMHGPITFAVLEGFSGRSSGQLFSLGEISGVLRLRLWEREIPHAIFAPASIKKFFAGKGNAKKPDMLREANRVSHLAILSDDEADALACAHLARQAHLHLGCTGCMNCAKKKTLFYALAVHQPA